jgi:hypothetical protein
MADNDVDHVRLLPSRYLIDRIPTYIITATYFGPAAIWLYWRYGRPETTQEQEASVDETKLEDPPLDSNAPNADTEHQMNEHHMHHGATHNVEDGHTMMHQHMHHHQHQHAQGGHHKMEHQMDHSEHHNVDEEQMPEHHMHQKAENEPSNDEEAQQMPEDQMTQDSSNGSPFYVSVLIGVTHCGAGCVLGDIVGEWIVYGTNVTINGRSLWPEFLIGTKSQSK